MLSWSLIIAVGLAGAVLAFWQHGLGIRDRANAAAQEACARMGLQFLDGTVAFAKLSLARNDQGRLSLRRTFVFDYTSDSIGRRQGFVVALGRRIEHIGFERDRDNDDHHDRSPPALNRDDHAPSPAPRDNVLVLDDWRRRRDELAKGRPDKAPKRDSHTDSGW